MVTDHDAISGPGAPGSVPRSGRSAAHLVPPTDRAGYLRAWSALHGDYDVASSVLVRGWLALTYGVARPLVRGRVTPGAVTTVGVMLAIAALGVAALGGPWASVAAAVLLVASALTDSLDGAVALLRGRSSALGYVADSVADRISDLTALGILVVLGGPPAAVLAIAALTLLQETLRARAVSAGMNDIGVVTVWERPSRIIAVTVTVLGCVFVADTTTFALIGTAVAGALAVIGFGQLVLTVRRRLRGHDAPRVDRIRG
ncbi:CDP-alcohol phosphatidyltransferase family protein [Rhodococcoides corynebacterioides]|uniref:CDP-alcohol phosphatidyltransferase family protein n=1 Tax=Rhodococcoides corynebacterioides TaxID=53972 RepID=UPI001C9B6516|nr:CDP-alcohol phosphatidyltransferase family protein [Rhodococcus corynebacterioides]